MRSAADILSISTGRETILIGPLSSFGVQSAKSVLRERHSVFQTLQVFVSRPNAEEMVRPHLRRWGIDSVSIRASSRHSLIEALARAAAMGTIGVARVPEVTLAFAGASLDDQVGKAKPFAVEGPHLPPGLADRMAIVFALAPDYMEGETKLAFDEAVKSLGMTVIVGGVCAWIGAHFIPGVNIAMLAFDLFFLSTEVLHALEKAAEIIEDVRVAKSRKDLEPAAQAFAMVLGVLIVNGILSRLLKAKSLTKGVGKTGGGGDGKPALAKERSRQRPRREDKLRDQKDASSESTPRKKKDLDGNSPTAAQSQKARELGVDEKWVTADGHIKWPPNDGFDGPPRDKTLRKGEVISRYGGDSGTFTAPDGTPFEQRSLPASSSNQGERKFRVKKELPVKEGKSASWFGESGGGTQYKSDKSIGDLLDEGIIEEIF